ncbi:GlsB/YeaQ/YmgE family stress response membrane protein [Sorangium cellulosum]|nr:GlsB/YeaQ/YmgE family stress response membrane protein [Sorangium cellulosum]
MNDERRTTNDERRTTSEALVIALTREGALGVPRSREERTMSVLLWILFGLIVGVIAKLLTPGRDPGGFVVTTLLGVAGALLGGFIGRAIGLYPSYQSSGGFFMSILGAILILAIYNATIGRKARP